MPCAALSSRQQRCWQQVRGQHGRQAGAPLAGACQLPTTHPCPVLSQIRRALTGAFDLVEVLRQSSWSVRWPGTTCCLPQCHVQNRPCAVPSVVGCNFAFFSAALLCSPGREEGDGRGVEPAPADGEGPGKCPGSPVVALKSSHGLPPSPGRQDCQRWRIAHTCSLAIMPAQRDGTASCPVFL